MFSRLFVLGLLCNIVYSGFTPAYSDETPSPNTPMKNNTPIEQPSFPRYHNNVFASVDFIYWNIKQEGNNYATSGTAITVPGTIDPNTGVTPPATTNPGSVYSPNPQMNPGFKAAFGINLEHNNWSTFIEYTYIRGKGHNSTTSNNVNAGIIPIFNYTPNNSILSYATCNTTDGGDGFISEANSTWSLNFNNITFELGRLLQFCPTFTLYPHFGLQSSWQKQRFEANYEVSAIADFSDLGNNKVLFDQYFWGLGPRVCLDSTWDICTHLGLFANSGIALLWGQFTGQALSYDTNTIFGYENVLIDNQISKFHTLNPVIELEIGMQTDWILKENYKLTGQVGWETQVWFFQNQHSSTIADTSLILQGLTVSLRCDF